jgi:hypothetical protein
MTSTVALIVIGLIVLGVLCCVLVLTLRAVFRINTIVHTLRQIRDRLPRPPKTQTPGPQ